MERLKQGGWATFTGHSPRLGLPTVNVKIIRLSLMEKTGRRASEMKQPSVEKKNNNTKFTFTE